MGGNIDFSTGQVLTAAQLNDIGDWKSWPPTLTNFTLGNGTMQAKYCQVGEITFMQFYFLGGSTSSYGTSFRFSVPVTNDASDLQYQPAGFGWARPDKGGSIYTIVGQVITTNLVFYAQNRAHPSTNYVYNASLTSSVPATWQTSGDMADIFFQGWYRTS